MKLAHHKKQLEEEKQKLESQMAEIGRRNPAVPDDWEQNPVEDSAAPDLIDQAEVLVNRDTTKAIFNDLEARYDAVLSALGRIEKGTYGVCSECGAPIEEARLDANPTAATCIAHR